MKRNQILSPEDVKFFHSEGYLGPFTMMSEAQMGRCRPCLEETIYGSKESPIAHQPLKSRHIDDRLVYDLCSHPAVLSRISQILGPNLILWQSNFFNKEPNTQAYPWHQDSNFWAQAIEPPINVSAWLAIDDTDQNNSCVQLFAGSHKRNYPHVKTTSFAPEFSQQADPSAIPFDQEAIVSMELKAGEFFLFNERTLHRSSANQSKRRRLGLAIRITTPLTRVYKNHPVFLVKGEDGLRFNNLANPP